MNRRYLWVLMLLTGAALADGYPSSSLYQLPAVLTDTAGQQHALDSRRGQPVLVTLFYGSCPAACPLLIDTLRATERVLTSEELASLRVLMISIDPDRDSPEALAALAKTRRIDLSRWELASTDAATVRKLAAALNVQYRRLPDGGFNHTSVITLLDGEGSMIHRSSTLGSADPELVNALRKQLHSK